jgi:hypothetical protein
MSAWRGCTKRRPSNVAADVDGKERKITAREFPNNMGLSGNHENASHEIGPGSLYSRIGSINATSHGLLSLPHAEQELGAGW